MPLLALTTPDATLAAAGIAAVAGVVKLVSDALTARGAATRGAHRTVLEPHLSALASNIHAVVAGAIVVHRRVKDGQAPGQALDNSKEAAEALKGLRLEVKYTLPGLDEPLRRLTRTPDWIATYNGHESGDLLVESIQKLSHLVDATITRSYRRGRPPTRWEQWRLSRAARDVRATWDKRFAPAS